MEKILKIKLIDKHKTEGVLNTKKGNNSLIIFVHGLTGNRNEHIFFNAAKFFPEKKFDTFRFDLYSWPKDCRNLTECTIDTHATDLTTVINYFKNKYSKIFLVGHSLGGPSILFSDPSNVTAIVLWDPSFGIFHSFKDNLKFNKHINRYIMPWGIEVLLSSEMLNSWKKVDARMLKLFIKPTKVICAGKAKLWKIWKKELSNLKIKHDFFIIKNAGHCFDEEGAEEILFKETWKWFCRY